MISLFGIIFRMKQTKLSDLASTGVLAITRSVSIGDY